MYAEGRGLLAEEVGDGTGFLSCRESGTEGNKGVPEAEIFEELDVGGRNMIFL